MMRKTFAVLVMACILVTGCGSAKAEQTTPAQAEQVAVEATTEQAATTAEQAAVEATTEQAATTAEQATVEMETATRENPLIVVDTDESLEFFYENGEIIMIFDGKEVIIRKNLREEIHSGNILEEDLPGQLRASIRLERAKRR